MDDDLEKETQGGVREIDPVQFWEAVRMLAEEVKLSLADAQKIYDAACEVLGLQATELRVGTN